MRKDHVTDKWLGKYGRVSSKKELRYLKERKF